MKLSKIISFFRELQLKLRFFIALLGICILFACSFGWPIFFPIGLSFLFILLAMLLADTVLLYLPGNGVRVKRSLPRVLNLGDENLIRLDIRSNFPLDLRVELIDEIPDVFQERSFGMHILLKANSKETIEYFLRPVKRGKYAWGNVNLILQTRLGLAGRHIRGAEPAEALCYPSILQMKQFEIRAFARVANYQGIKRMRRLGHSYEFEQIKHYVQGDDIRSINWKATSRHSELMVNQFEDERSQQVYCILDKSRSMHMPFHGMSLLDHAINTCLVISNIALKKHDRAGLITFSNKIGTAIRADRSRSQLKQILNALADEQSREQEADFDLLYRSVKNVISGRSLIFLFLNFESTYAMERALPVLRSINRQHLLVVILFVNTELEAYVHSEVKVVGDMYTQTLAQKLLSEKRHMAHLLNQFGIQTILTRPEELSLHTVNKYLELKARGLI